jgi:hypothetical protein
MQKTQSISLRVTEDVKKAVERAARCEQLTMAGVVDRVLIEGLRQRGYLRPTPSPPSERDSQIDGPEIASDHGKMFER